MCPPKSELHPHNHQLPSTTPPNSTEAGDGNQVTLDPVCGMTVKLGMGKPTFEHEGQTYHFCNPKCKERFSERPEYYLTGEHKKAAEEAPEGTMFTCPMDPEIVQEGPGICPVCGMALEPMTITLEAPVNHELIDFTRRFWVSLLCAVPLLIISMGGMLGLSFESVFQPHMAQWFEMALAAPVMLWAAAPLFQRAYSSVITGNFNMWTLIGLGTATATIYSVFAVLFPQFFPDDFLDMHGLVPTQFEAAVVIVTLVFLGQIMELRARDRTGNALRSLLSLAPRTAVRLRPSQADEVIPIEQVKLGDTLRIRSGEAIPVDGIVREGHSVVDESMITGEPIPVSKSPSSKVTAGTLNTDGMLLIKATKVGKDTMLSQIVNLVAASQRSRAPIQSLADNVSGYFVMAVVAVAIATFAIWSLFGPSPSALYGLINMVAVLIIACPCAIGLATPMSIMVASGRGARAGVLFRSAEALEILAAADTLVIDKTGTLTEGRPQLKSSITSPNVEETQLLQIAYSLEAGSTHPLAGAIATIAREKGLKASKVEQFSSIPGEGVSGIIDGHSAHLGNEHMIKKLNISLEHLKGDILSATQRGETVVIVAYAEKALGLLGFRDELRKDVATTISELKRSGLNVIMATGDNHESASLIAKEAGITEIKSKMLPKDKLDLVNQLKERGRTVAFAGDGINDAPALAAANVGIAMGSGSDVALETATMTLIKGESQALLRARRLALGTMRNIKQNLFFAFVYNVVGVSLAAGILYPQFGILLPPMFAALAMSLSSVSVISNALRLNGIRL